MRAKSEGILPYLCVVFFHGIWGVDGVSMLTIN